MTFKVMPLYTNKDKIGCYCVIIDADCFRKIKKYRWRVHFSGGKNKKKGQPYARACIKGRYVYLHRLLMNAPEGMEVDHKNHQTLDCRKTNLEVIDRVTNNRRRRCSVNP